VCFELARLIVAAVKPQVVCAYDRADMLLPNFAGLGVPPIPDCGAREFTIQILCLALLYVAQWEPVTN
jgi:hypothetical protein